jgi:hypothetical protein
LLEEVLLLLLLEFPKYMPCRNLKVCVICASMIQRAFQKRLDRLIGGWGWIAICIHRGVCILLEILVHFVLFVDVTFKMVD